MVSIIILVQDRYAEVKRCLESILENTTSSDYELVLILQAIPESSPIVGMCYGLPCKKIIIENEINTGVTPGRNQGIDASSGDYLLFFDDDAYVDNDLQHIPEEERNLDWLERMTQYFSDSVGVVAQSGYYIDPQRKGIFFSVEMRGADCDVGQGYCFMFSKKLVQTSGKLDPFFGKFWHEESEFALRAKFHGFRVRSAGYIGVQHAGSGSGDDGSYGTKYEYMYSKWKPHFNKILVGKDNWK